jgi:hypothetical protein
VTIARSSAPRGGLACHSAFNEAPVAFNEAPVDSVDLVCRVEQQDIQALHRARQRGGREGTLSVRNNPAIRGLVGWRAYMCAPARARRTFSSRPPGRGAFFACRGLSFLKARRNR